MKKIKYIILFSLSTIFHTTVVYADREDINSQLKLAESYKSQSPERFQSIITNLAKIQLQMTTEQQSYLSYLNAYNYTYKGDYKNATLEVEKILSTSANTKLKAKTEALLLNIYAASQQWQLATNKASFLLTYNEKKSPKAYVLAHINAAALYVQLNQYKLARSVLLSLNDSTLSPRDLCIKYQLKLSAQMSMKNGLVSTEELKEGINNCEQANELTFKNIIKGYQAKLYLREKKPLDVLDLLLSSQTEVEQTQYALLIASMYNSIAQAYFSLSEFDKAVPYADKALKLIDKVKLTKQATDTYRLNFLLAEQRGDLASALDFHKQYLAAERAYMDETTSRHLAFHMANRRDLENQNRINLLNAENERLSTNKKLTEEERQSFYLLSSLLLFIVAALVLWLVYASYTNRKFKQLAEQDFLTGIFNRRKFVQIANSVLSDTKESDQEVSCILFDLDRFKQINDSFGHAIGDTVLKRVVECCTPLLPEEHVFARIGGEEFIVLLPDTTVEVAQYVARQCSEEIRKINLAVADLNVAVSASFGVTNTMRSGYNIEDIMADADGAMYNAKNMGRGVVTLFR